MNEVRFMLWKNGEKMNIIFLHGLGQSPASWNGTVSSLSSNIKADCPDLFGLWKGKDITYEKIYLSFEMYLDAFSEPVILCGISLGAVLALNYAINHTEKVKSLILIAPQYKMPRLLLKLQNIIFRIMPENSFLSTGMEKKDIIRLTNSMMKLDFQDNLGNILCPTLIICGKKDSANIKAAKKLVNLISNAKLIVIDNAGHEINMIAPHRLAAEINLFCCAS